MQRTFFLTFLKTLSIYYFRFCKKTKIELNKRRFARKNAFFRTGNSLLINMKKIFENFHQKRTECFSDEKSPFEKIASTTNNDSDTFSRLTEKLKPNSSFSKEQVANLMQLMCKLPDKCKQEIIIGIKNGVDVSVFTIPILNKVTSDEKNGLQLTYSYLSPENMKIIRMALQENINIMPIYECDALAPPFTFTCEELSVLVKAIKNNIDIYSPEFMSLDDFSRKKFDFEKIKMQIKRAEKISMQTSNIKESLYMANIQEANGNTNTLFTSDADIKQEIDSINQKSN